jgi:hypothetical protein
VAFRPFLLPAGPVWYNAAPLDEGSRGSYTEPKGWEFSWSAGGIAKAILSAFPEVNEPLIPGDDFQTQY